MQYSPDPNSRLSLTRSSNSHKKFKMNLKPVFIAFAYTLIISNSLSCNATVVDDEAQEITVAAITNPEWKSYSAMLKGVTVFEKYHQLAPNAPLLFQLIPRGEQLTLEGVNLRIATEDKSIPILLETNATFSLPAAETVNDSKAELILNRKKDTFKWRPYIRSPETPKHMRRLGDFRLECEIDLAIEKEDASLLKRGFLATLGDICNSEKILHFYKINRPLSNIVLMAGERREALGSNYLGPDGKSFRVPLHIHSWPDDTLIEFKFKEGTEQE
jgi:hypothetical protein